MGWGCPLFQLQRILACAEYKFWINHQLELFGHNRSPFQNSEWQQKRASQKNSRGFLAALKRRRHPERGQRISAHLSKLPFLQMTVVVPPLNPERQNAKPVVFSR